MIKREIFSAKLVCTKKLTIYYGMSDRYQVHGTLDDQGRRQISQNGNQPPLGVRQIGLYFIIQVNSELTILWDQSMRAHIIAEDSLKGNLFFPKNTDIRNTKRFLSIFCFRENLWLVR